MTHASAFIQHVHKIKACTTVIIDKRRRAVHVFYDFTRGAAKCATDICSTASMHVCESIKDTMFLRKRLLELVVATRLA